MHKVVEIQSGVGRSSWLSLGLAFPGTRKIISCSFLFASVNGCSKSPDVLVSGANYLIRFFTLWFGEFIYLFIYLQKSISGSWEC